MQRVGLPFATATLMYRFAEYVLHRFVLHSRLLYRSLRTVALWKRIHYDHHADLHDLRVLFGALPTMLPTIALVTLPTEWIVGGAAGAAAAFAAGVACMLLYEFVHCVGHLAYTPRSPLLQHLKRLHLLHHFHNERGNFGITSFLVDRVASTYYDQPGAMPRSATVFNLGSGDAERRRYPWLAQRSALPDRAHGARAGR
jgi:sterol desaturase/sphingolipid hydroxylase (fatty acid hydroxylase superfamily)